MSASIPSESTRTITGGKIFLEALQQVGVRYLFANVGSYETGLYDALVETPDIQLINGLHEGIVISMTEGYHRASGGLGVANVHSIAGTTQMAGQLYNAFVGHSALLVTAGFIENDLIHDDIVLAAPSGYQQSEIIRPLTKNSWQVRSTAGVYGFSQRAIQCALTPPEGPVYLAFPDAVMRGEVSVQELPGRGFTPRRFEFLAPERDISEAVQMIIKAKSLAILAGDDLYRYGAREEAVKLAEATGAACFSARPCFANFPTDHPLFGGAYSQIPHIFNEAPDLLIFLGARSFSSLPTILFPPAPLYRRGLWIGSNAIDMARCERIEMGIVAHPKSALQQLLFALQDAASASWQQEIFEPRRSRIKEAIRSLRERVDPSAHSDHIPIHPA
ncbi:MAG: thiamine pyrophosphate-binding protein, partial [Deltaproteobacteria bacterium]|nr:thiamine pyrophosphate-binding protein [Deltaproteobacteria bacterium]